MEGTLLLYGDEVIEIPCVFYESNKKTPHAGKYFISKTYVEKLYRYKHVKLKFNYMGQYCFFPFIYFPVSDRNSYSVEVVKNAIKFHICASMEIDAGSLKEITIRIY